MFFRLDRATLDELALVRAEAQRMGVDEECFAASYFGLSLQEYRIWIATGEKPVGHDE